VVDHVERAVARACVFTPGRGRRARRGTASPLSGCVPGSSGAHCTRVGAAYCRAPCGMGAGAAFGGGGGHGLPWRDPGPRWLEGSGPSTPGLQVKPVQRWLGCRLVAEVATAPLAHRLPPSPAHLGRTQQVPLRGRPPRPCGRPVMRRDSPQRARRSGAATVTPPRSTGGPRTAPSSG
jgi:hypothetical protein